MAEDNKAIKELEGKKAKAPEEKKKEHRPETIQEESLIRILGYDIPGSRNIYAGLTRIKGVSWSISNAVCLKLGFPRNKRISELSKQEIEKIESFFMNIKIPAYLMNRRIDPETGAVGHFYSTDLDMKREFDIKRMKKIKSYKGVRHSSGQPVRGQRTRSHFRAKKKAGTGIIKPAAPAEKAAAPAKPAKK
jgi:small subunit ribosomal protein S13